MFSDFYIRFPWVFIALSWPTTTSNEQANQARPKESLQHTAHPLRHDTGFKERSLRNTRKECLVVRSHVTSRGSDHSVDLDDRDQRPTGSLVVYTHPVDDGLSCTCQSIITYSSKKLLVTRASLLVTRASLLVTRASLLVTRASLLVTRA